MAKRGRPRKADALHKVDGTYRKDRHASTMAVIPGTQIEAPPSPPEWLGSYGADEWSRLVSLLDKVKILSKTDLATLTALCNEWDEYVRSSIEAKLVGRYYKIFGKPTEAKNDDGDIEYIDNVVSVQIHPLHTITQQHLKMYISLCNEFGLSPASRAKVPHESADERKTPMAKRLRNAL
jgi:P27 family predicted phage terminase small subunit